MVSVLRPADAARTDIERLHPRCPRVAFLICVGVLRCIEFIDNGCGLVHLWFEAVLQDDDL